MKFTVKGRIPSKKNSRINTRSGRSFPSKKYKEWHHDASWQLFTQKKKLFTHCKITIAIYAPDKRRFDLTNKAESIMDLLVDCGILEDDNVNVVPAVQLLFKGVDRENPRAEITITDL